MIHEELPLTEAELEEYFRFESEIEKYSDAISVMVELVDKDLFPKPLGQQVLAELNSKRTQKEMAFENLQAK